jgi:hypothetical protein
MKDLVFTSCPRHKLSGYICGNALTLSKKCNNVDKYTVLKMILILVLVVERATTLHGRRESDRESAAEIAVVEAREPSYITIGSKTGMVGDQQSASYRH